MGVSERMLVTHFQDGTEGCGGDVGADGGEDGLADLSDVSALLGEQRQQDVHHHLHPLRLCILLLSSCTQPREIKKTFASKINCFFYPP